MDTLPENREKVEELYVQALLLTKVVERILQQKANIKLSAEPIYEMVDIIDFMKRMRVWSLEKFNNTTYISTINFYKTNDDMKHHRALGAIVIFVGEEYIVDLFRRLGYPNIDDDDEEILKDACGTFCNLIAAKFKVGLTQLGYDELVMSHFSSYQNEVLNGVEYDNGQTQKYEISFEIGEIKRIVAELTMGPLPKSHSQ